MKEGFIPGTNPVCGRELPDDMDNSLVDKYGNLYDNGYNFDERDDGDDGEGSNETTFESIREDRELVDYVKDEIIYTGLFFDPDELYDKFPPSLVSKPGATRIRDPHVTVTYLGKGDPSNADPNVKASKVFLDSLGSNVTFRIIGYGNNGQNEGLEVEIIHADDSEIQETLQKRVELDENGEKKPVIMHITTALAEGAKAYDTKDLDFKPLETPVMISGVYKFFRNDGELISNRDEIREMKESGFAAEEVSDADRMPAREKN